MSVWILHVPPDRLSKEGQAMLHLPFDDMPDMSHAHSQAEMRQRLREMHPDMPPETLSRLTDRQWRYTHSLGREDILAMPQPELNVMAFAQVEEPVTYENGHYAVRVRFFSRRVPLKRFFRHRRIFEYRGVLLHEVEDGQLRTLIRDLLPLKGNKFRKLKWLIVAVIALKAVEMGVRIWKAETAGF